MQQRDNSAHSSENVSVDVSDEAGGSQRQPKPRPVPLAFPDDSPKRQRQYGTFGPALVGGGAAPDGDAATTAYEKHLLSPDGKSVPPADGSLWGYLISPQSPIVKMRDHCQHQWVAVVLTILVMLVILFTVFHKSAPLPATGCNTGYGVYLGDYDGVAAYSNCRFGYSGDGMENHVSIGLKRVYTGVKWDSLEYARRYWILSRFITFDSRPATESLMNESEVSVVRTGLSRQQIRGGATGALSNLKVGQRLPLRHFYNLPGPLLAPEAAAIQAEILLAADTPAAAEAELEAVQAYRPTGLLAPRPYRGGEAKHSGGSRNRLAGANLNGVSMREFLLDRGLAVPTEGDLVVYETHRKMLPKGHVAVVVGVQGPFRSLAGVGHRLLDSPVAPHLKGGADATPPSPDDLLRPGQDPKDHFTAAEIIGEHNGTTSISPSAGSGLLAGRNHTAGAPAADEALDPFRYRMHDNEADCVFFRVYIAEQNWNNRAWVDLVERGGGQGGGPFRAPRIFSRVLLLKQYYPSQTVRVEDNSGHRVLGWVRPPV